MASSSTTSAAAAAAAPVAEADKKKITLKSSDDKLFEVLQTVVSLSVTIKNIIEEDYAGDVIPLHNVTGLILDKVIEYCNKHAEAGDGGEKEELKAWEKRFEDIDLDVLFELIMAANYLNVKGLLDLTCQTVADKIKEMTPEQIREIFHIENDFTKKEEDEIRRENRWAFE